jgi:alpha-tubulin suppressor-like RCC1 family protein
MAEALPAEAALLDLPLEMLAAVCLQLDGRDLVRVSETCTRFRHGDGGLEMVELPTKSPVVPALRDLAFARPELVPLTRPNSCSESWVACLARCARQRRCPEAPPIRAEDFFSLFVDAAGRLLACGEDVEAGVGDVGTYSFEPIPAAAMAGERVHSVAAKSHHGLALGWNGRVYSWGDNEFGQLGHGDRLVRHSPALVEGLEGVCGVEAASTCSFAVTQSRDVIILGGALRPDWEASLRPIIVEGFGGVRVRRVRAGSDTAFAIGEDGELFSWGDGEDGLLGHGDEQDQPLPKRVEALRSVRVSSAAVDLLHALALAEDGLVYAWGENEARALLGNPRVEREPLPKPVEALWGVRVSSVAVGGARNYAVADTGELWAWGYNGDGYAPLGHGQQTKCPLPKPVDSLRGIKVDAVAASDRHTLALTNDGSVYAWGDCPSAILGALGRGRFTSRMRSAVLTPRRVHGLGPPYEPPCDVGDDEDDEGSNWSFGDNQQWLRPRVW